MNVFVFGNEDVDFDNNAIKVAKELEGKISGIEFVFVKPNEDLPFTDGSRVVIIDTVEGINNVTVMKDSDLDKLSVVRGTTAHDFDLGFQLRYLKKIGKLGEVTIVGLPMNNEVDYSLIQSILRKLVAQDIQGS